MSMHRGAREADLFISFSFDFAKSKLNNHIKVTSRLHGDQGRRALCMQKVKIPYVLYIAKIHVLINSNKENQLKA